MKRIIDFLEKNYPSDICESFDKGKIGLQFGTKNKKIKKIMIALDGTLNVVNQAVREKVDLLLLHHPFMFNPLLSLDYDSPFGVKLKKILDNNINIFAMHTNFDVSANGMNDRLAEIICLNKIKNPLGEYSNQSLIRVGEIDELTLAEYAYYIKEKLQEPSIRLIGKLDKKIRKVSIIGGSGAYYIDQACRISDVLITGEVKHNQAIDVLEKGFAVIEVSHFIEHFFKFTLQKEMQKEFPDIEILIADEENPFNTL